MKLKRRINAKLALAIIASICLLAGVPVVVLCAVYGIWLGMAMGIAMVAFGFYGSPLLWLSYARTRSLLSVWQTITDDHILTVTEISSNLGRTERNIRSSITRLLANRYLVGYSFADKQQLVAIQPTETSGKTTISNNKCDNCGALLVEEADKYTCPYCGTWYKK